MIVTSGKVSGKDFGNYNNTAPGEFCYSTSLTIYDLRASCEINTLVVIPLKGLKSL
jgi:hypothetical protein